MKKLAITYLLVLLFTNSSAKHYNNFEDRFLAYEVKQMDGITNYSNPAEALNKIQEVMGAQLPREIGSLPE